MGNWIASLFKINTKIVIVGLDAAGKTTILYRLKHKEDLSSHIHTIPTIGFNVETLQIGRLEMTAWDIGGQDRIRHLWNHYFEHTDAIVMVVDSQDKARFKDVKIELDKLIENPQLEGVPILFFANKQDLPGCADIQEMTTFLGLDHVRDRQWYIHPCSAVVQEGLESGFKWIQRTLNSQSRRSSFFGVSF